MKIVSGLAELKDEIRAAREAGKAIGFVPTMGSLHRGHAALLETARRENDFLVLSIYVNPTQFGPNEDFEKYPRAFAEDKKIAEAAGVDLIFHPSTEVIYPPGYSTFIEVEGVSAPLCGAYRPGHFRGVATVVQRLFQLVQPTAAYFGKKDIQQCLVIQRMVTDLALGIKLRFCGTIREADGLAMSSRNQYLTPAERKQAPELYRVLQALRAAFDAGERSAERLASLGRGMISRKPEFRLQYLDVLSYPDLRALPLIGEKAVCAFAVYLGGTRLIDNIILGDVE